jgi:uncharacterized membrane protein
MQQQATIMEASFTGGTDLGTARRPRGQPIHRMLVWFSAAYFAAALVTDILYWQMLEVMWERFSIWLITAGLIMAGLAIVAYVIDLASRRRIDRPVWPRAIGYATAVLLALANAFVHSRDAYTAVVPTGLALSALVVIVLVLTAVVGGNLTNSHRFEA